MNRFFVDFDGRVFDKSIDITGEDVNHIKNVLRLKVNDEIIISDGRGRDYRCQISVMDHEKVVADILDVCDNFAELETGITLFQGFPKADKMEWIIQKTVELGDQDRTGYDETDGCQAGCEESRKEDGTLSGNRTCGGEAVGQRHNPGGDGSRNMERGSCYGKGA